MYFIKHRVLSQYGQMKTTYTLDFGQLVFEAGNIHLRLVGHSVVPSSSCLGEHLQPKRHNSINNNINLYEYITRKYFFIVEDSYFELFKHTLI